jgi:hypothetical protein
MKGELRWRGSNKISVSGHRRALSIGHAITGRSIDIISP